jgi:putative heme-binding domain-containing protein
MLLRAFCGLVAAYFLFPDGTRAQDQSNKSTFFLPQNPVAAAYVLGRLSDQELIDAPRSEFVYVALLQRPGLAQKYRLEALDGLSRLRHSNWVAELLRCLAELDKKGEGSSGVMLELSPLLMASTATDLVAQRGALEELAGQSQLPLTRQIAYAALLTALGSLDPLWDNAAPAHLSDLILAIPLLPESARPTGAYTRIAPLLAQTNAPDVLRAAMSAVAAVPGHEAAAFAKLAKLIETRVETPTAIASVARIPRRAWPQAEIEPLASSLVEYLQNTAPAERTKSEFTRALQLANDLASHLPKERALALRATLRGLGPALFVLHAVYEQMRFDTRLLVVEPAQPVAITLENNDAMPHNLAILSPGALEEIGLAAEKMAAEPDAEGRLYVPASPKVLYATKLVAPGRNVQLAFAAPSEPGEYPFVCTFPGHWRRMTGTLAVTTNVEAYLANAARSAEPPITEWKLADLAPDLPKLSLGRDLQTGADFFTKLACIQCHRLGDRGYAYGPDLTDVFLRYTNDAANVLEQILDPSKIITERYRPIEFQLKSSEPVTGMILKEDNEKVTVQTGPADSLIQTLHKAEIRQRQPQKSSPMPLGLLNTLSKQQILDLLAYIQAGGKLPEHHPPTASSQP